MNSHKVIVFFILISCGLICFTHPLKAQKKYFIDGYHGGIWGHFPYQYASFMAGQLKAHPNWKINLEIEPVTWDSIEHVDPEGYAYIKRALEDTSVNACVEYVNPAYGQSYLFNISGESIIRQFQYGISALEKHFPDLRLTTYSSEEPCFTSALPGILGSLGFQFASLKNPNTCWGGYVAGHKGGIVNWIGPDGSSLLTVPRYQSEKLEKGSTWQTTAWRNSPEYIQAALDDGIPYPIGMCLQDAGWREGPWLGEDTTSIYTTWSHYFKQVVDTQSAVDWKLSQEDIKVSLVWGGQILQKVAQAVRKTENTLTSLETILTLKHIFQRRPWPQNALDKAWKNLLLAQHHDCWIVPNNSKFGKNWQNYVASWTSAALKIADSLVIAGADINRTNAESTSNPDHRYIRVYNSAAVSRTELVRIKLPEPYVNKTVKLLDKNGQEMIIQQNGDDIHFYARVPSLGYATYQLQSANRKSADSGMVTRLPGGNLVVNSDRYRVFFDAAKGGMITSLQLTKADNLEMVDQTKGGLNELKGFFYDENKFRSSKESPAKLTVLENGRLMARVQVEGRIAGSPFKQVVQIDKKGELISTDLHIDWKGHPGIGQFDEDDHFKNEHLKKAFYNSRYKLLTLFPVRHVNEGVITKDAPFDIVESRLKNTFYDSWDHIKNDVLLHWVDLSGRDGKAGLTVFSDETTSYAHGADLPLALTTQYSGKGLFGADYQINGPTHMRYGILPHLGNWKTGKVTPASESFNKPLRTALLPPGIIKEGDWSRSFLKLAPGSGWEMSSFKVDPTDGSLILRIWNPTGNDMQHPLLLSQPIKSATVIELNGRQRNELNLSQGGKAFELSIPSKGFRTIRLQGW